MYFLFAFDTLTYKLDHINREDYQGRFWISIDNDTGIIDHSPVVHFQGDFWKTHGWATWLSWSFFSLGIVFTQRFGAVYWRNSLTIHITLGVLSITLTLFFTAAGLIKAGKFKNQTHAWIGLFMCCIVWMEGVTGFYAYRTGQVQRWNSRSVVISKRIHKIFGYFLIAIAQYETQIGIIQYEEEWGLQPLPYGYINAVFMFVSVILLEVHFRVRRSQMDKFINPLVIMSTEEFNARIKKGERLAIIDDLVIDVT